MNELPPGGDAQSEERGGKENRGQSQGVVLLNSWCRGMGERRAERKGGAQGEPGVRGRELGPLAWREPRERQEILADRRGWPSRRQLECLWGRSGCERWRVRRDGCARATAVCGNSVFNPAVRLQLTWHGAIF